MTPWLRDAARSIRLLTIEQWHPNKTWTVENRPEDWKEQMNRGDRCHDVRVAAFALLAAALT